MDDTPPSGNPIVRREPEPREPDQNNDNTPPSGMAPVTHDSSEPANVISYSALEPETPGVLITEPEIKKDDTQPRAPVVTEFVRKGSGSYDDDGAEGDEDDGEARSGCGNRLLIGATAIAFLCLIVSAIGLAGLAGWRDGVNDAQAKKAAALVGTVGVQATLARQDCSDGRYELCSARCSFIATVQPAFPGMPACMSTAAMGMSATPTQAATNTPTPEPPTPTVAGVATVADGTFSKEELFVRAQEATRILEYENTVKWLEPLRGLDADYRRQEVEDMLVTAYQALGKRYENELRLSEMIVVIKKALKIRPLAGTSWEFTINAAQLYLDGKNFLAAGDIAHADAAFQKFMDIAPTYLDGKQLACEAFAAAGDTAYAQKYCQ